MGFTKTIMKGLPQYNSKLISSKNYAKFENYCISRNAHRIKFTQPNSMILVSFSSAEGALTKDLKEYEIFSSQGCWKSAVPLIWGDTRYIHIQGNKPNSTWTKRWWNLYVLFICVLYFPNIKGLKHRHKFEVWLVEGGGGVVVVRGKIKIYGSGPHSQNKRECLQIHTT